MKAKELIEILKQHPDADVFYEDMNFSCKSERLGEYHHIKYSDEHKCFLIESLMWDELT